MRISPVSCFLSGSFALVLSLSAQTLTTIHTFDKTENGAEPYGALVQATDGNFYGTTVKGGSHGYGTIFRITPSGRLTTLHDFDYTDGEFPYAGLMQASDGNFYGTTAGGGANGDGTIFQFKASSALTTLHSFDGSDGERPYAELIQATDGNFYGTTTGGGAVSGLFTGTVFKMTPKGTLTTLYSFCSQTYCADGQEPAAGLVQATNGNLYGTTYFGGTSYGTVFEITTSGTLTTLYSFNGTDGSVPSGTLIQATDGNFYGTTVYGPPFSGGTVFKITTSGVLTTLYSFCSQINCADGLDPSAGLVQATDGNFYGATPGGGASGDGTLFEITPNGTFTSLHSFDGTDGELPFDGLIQGTDGNLYGTTSAGGPNVYGTVFRLSLGLRPFVKMKPSSGKVGTVVTILGSDLKGSTGVKFNGTAAAFTVVLNSEIKATVPAGATTGKVQVSTPKGTLTSNINFRVTP